MLSMLRAGMLVYIMVVAKNRSEPCAERLVVLIMHRNGNRFYGKVWQENIGRTAYHGLSKFSDVTFTLKQILEPFFENPDKAKMPKSQEIKLI